MILAFPIILVPLALGSPLVASTILTAFSFTDTLAKSINYTTEGFNAAVDYYSVIKRVE